MEVKIMKNSIMKKLIAVLLIIVLTMVDFALLGVEAVSYAVEALSEGTATNNRNVTFDSYFKDANGAMITSKEESISNSDMKLYVQLSVKNEGYFNGAVTIGEGNFKLKSDIQNTNINKIEGNTITLNQINSGETVELELGIETIKEDTINSGLLSMNTNISINGIYRNSEERDIEIGATREVNLVLTSPYGENEGLELTSEVITNKVYTINGQNKRIVQVLVESGLKDNLYPVKENNIEVSVPEGVEVVEVRARGMLNSNGKEETEFNSSNWNYIETEHKVKITIKNEEENGTIKWNKTGKDSLVVTYIMAEGANVTGTDITEKSTITMYDVRETKKEAIVTSKVLEEKDGVITTGIALEEASMYKGKIYSGESREYKVATKVYVNEAKTGKEIKVDLNPSAYEVAGGEETSNIQYVNTTIKKTEIERILGTTGKLTITTENGAQTIEITKDTEADESGNIVITYAKGVKGIKVETTEAKAEGTINLEHTKVIKEEGRSIEEKRAYTGIIEKATGAESRIELKETEIKAEINIDKTRLTTLGINENVEITATMKTNSEKYELFKNPTFEIELPEGIKNINLKGVQLVYAEMFRLKEDAELDGNRIIITLEGEQTNYTAGVNESTVVITADIEFDTLTASNTAEVRMNYTNENRAEGIYTESKKVEIESKYGLMMYTTMEGYNEAAEVVTTMDDEVAKGSLDIEVSSREAKVKTVTINNYDEGMEEVSIIGRIPTEGMSDGTINTEMTEVKTTLEGTEIMYSTEVNAKAGDNTWTINKEGAKAFKVTVGSLAKGAKVEVEYSFKIPENMSYGESIYAKVDAEYTYLGNRMEQTSKVGAETPKLTGINRTTLREAVVTNIEEGLTANIGTTTAGRELQEGDSIYEGQAIEYTVQVTNNTGRNLQNAKISVEQENGTMYGLKEMEVVNDVVYKDTDIHMEHRYEELDTNKKEFNVIENFENGKTVQFKYEIVVNEVNSDAQTKGRITLKADDFAEKTIETISNKIEQAELKLNYKYYRFEEAKLYYGNTLETQLTIQNITDIALTNVEGKIILPDGTYGAEELYVSYLNEEFDTRLNNVKYNEADNTITFNISEIKPGENNKIEAIFYVEVREFNKPDIDLVFIAEATNKDKTYYSNQMVKNYINVQKDVTIKQETNIDDSKILQDDDEFNIIITAKNNTNADIIAIIDDELPASFKVLNAKLNTSNKTEDIEIIESEDEENINTDSSNIIIEKGATGSKLNVTEKLNKNDELKITLSIKVDAVSLEDQVKNIANLSYGETEEDGRFKYSKQQECEKVFKIKPLEISDKIDYVEVSQTSNVVNKSVIEDGQEIIYTARIKNISKEDVEIAIKDVLPDGLNVKQVLMNSNNITEQAIDNNVLNIENQTLGTNQEAELQIVTNYVKDNVTSQELSNIVKVVTPENTVSSNSIIYYTQVDEANGIDNQNGYDSQDNDNTANYTISGIAWLDENKDGQREENEQLLKDIKVKIIDTDTGSFVQENRVDLETTTTENGMYSFRLQRGNYIVIFMYDTNKYAVTQYQKSGVSNNQNSDVINKTIQINGTDYNVALTDTIKLISEDASDVDMGLLENTKFDFELKKYISEITVKTSKGVNTYNYNNAELAKVEIHAKELNNANVIIEYTIRVTNNGEIAGYVKDVTDYMPTALTFNSELNTEWHQLDKNLHNTSLLNTKIEAGETKDIKLILTKTMTESNTGLISNIAELTDVSNELGANDLDSTPGNKAQGEDDLGKADVIIGVKTGALVMYVGIVIAMLVIIGLGAYTINKRVLKENNIEEDIKF